MTSIMIPIFRRPLSFRTCALLGAQVLALALAGQAMADTVVAKFGPIEGVTVTDIKAGRIYYKSAATGKEANEDLGKIKGIKIEGVKGIEEAQAALAAKNDHVAVTKFNEAIRQAKLAKKPWLVVYAHHQLMACHLRLGEARLAAQQYLDLAQAKADPFYFQPPLPPAQGKPAEPALMDVVKAADENNRKAIFEQAKGLRNVDPNYQVFVAALIEATGIKEEVKLPDPATATATATGPATTPGAATGPNPATSIGSGPAVTAAPGSLLLPLRVQNDIRENASETGDIQLALAGRYGDAAKAMQGALRAKLTQTPVRLFVLGRVYQEMAAQEKDAAKKADLLKDAALCFARIGAQFNEPEASFYAPALLEFARINLELGDNAAAQKALEGAADLAEKAEEPAYSKRYKEVQAALEKK